MLLRHDGSERTHRKVIWIGAPVESPYWSSSRKHISFFCRVEVIYTVVNQAVCAMQGGSDPPILLELNMVRCTGTCWSCGPRCTVVQGLPSLSIGVGRYSSASLRRLINQLLLWTGRGNHTALTPRR